ncbi:MAG: hypothetical protein KGJ53_05140 [Alphaproteobacteria bacterium]|nr:hypothetical protein [Alphaproteobacteria bacterium]
MPFLLVEGGDGRLTVDPVNTANVYECSPHPCPGTLAFSSSTATSISERAYQRARRARGELIEASVSLGISNALDWRVESMRQSLRSLLGLGGAEIVFSPSGTDSQLHALFFIRQLVGGFVASVVVAADQTGGGTVHTCRGRHFSDRTAQGRTVVKGEPIVGASEDVANVNIPLISEDGTPRSEREVDAAVLEAVKTQIRAGHKVILQAMHSSKLGWRAPSDRCLRDVVARWPKDVQVVIDACQMRIDRSRLRSYLDRGYVVLLTGSKFFTGPAFSGASLWPQALSDRIAAMEMPPQGIADYATRFDLPLRWSSVRAVLSSEPNFGQWLRWEASLEEMEAYYALPESFRRSTLERLAEAVQATIASSPNLALVAGQGADTDGMPATIFPFFVRNGDRMLGLDEMTKIYHLLNRDISSALPETVKEEDRALAGLKCHIGQPVKLPGGTVLRINIGARTLSEAWSNDDDATERNICAVIDEIGTVVRKVELIVAADLARPK